MGELWPRRAGFPHPGENQAEKPVFPPSPRAGLLAFRPPSFSPQAAHGFHPAGKASQSFVARFLPAGRLAEFRRPQAAKKGEMGFSRGHTPGWLLLPLRGNSPSAPREKHFSPKAGRLFPKGIEVRLGCSLDSPRKNALHFCESKKKGRAENSARPFKGLYSVTKGSRAI